MATKVLVDNLAVLLNHAVPMVADRSDGMSRQVNRAPASKLFSRCIGRVLLITGEEG